MYRRQFHDFKTCLLGREFYTLMRDVSFCSLTDVESHHSKLNLEDVVSHHNNILEGDV